MATKFDTEGFNRSAREQKYKALRARASKEEKMWIKWDEGGRKPADLIPLMQSMETIVVSKGREFSGAGYGGALVRGGMEAEARRRLFKAIQSYDPNKGVPLDKYVFSQMRSMSDPARRRRNIVRASTTDTDQYAPFTNAVNALKARGMLHPTHRQIAEELKWPGKKGLNRVARVDQAIRKEMFITGPGDDEGLNRLPSSTRSALSLVVPRHDLDRQVLAYMKSANTSNKMTMEQLAKKLGVSQSKVTRSREYIKKQVQLVLKNQ